MKTVLVTGAPGFVGANLTRRLLEDGHQVHALVREDHDTWRLDDILEDLRLHEAVLANADSISRLIRTVRPEWVFHLAAHGAYPEQTDFLLMAETNLVGTMNLVESCLSLGVEALVNSGSSTEYGFKDHAPSESERLDPNSPYAVTKASATLYCRYAAVAHDANIVSLRLYSVYGPYEEPSRLWPTLVLHGLAGSLPVLASPDIARDFVYVDDVLEAYLRTASMPDLPRGSIFNVGSGIQTTLGHVVDLVRRELQISAEPEWDTMSGRTWDTDVWVSDITAIKRTLRWEPRWTLPEGLRALIAWFRRDHVLKASYERRLGL
jgi:nucleoside-diphosphate-sugar epimerase